MHRLVSDIRRISVPENRRIIAVSDIHAHLKCFMTLIDKVQLSDTDELFIIGDFIAKGPEDLATLRYVMEMDKRENVHVLMGNCEHLFYSNLFLKPDGAVDNLREGIDSMRKAFGGSLYEDMLRELGIPVDDSTDYAAALSEIERAYAAEFNFLASCPTVIETDHLIFVHGGIPTEELDTLEGRDAIEFLKCDDFLSQGYSFTKYVIAGHWPVCNYYPLPNFAPLVSRKQRIISIDGGTGVKSEGQLNAFIIADEKTPDYSFVSCDELPVFRALDSQSESKEYICFEYNDRAIEILEQGKVKSRVLHKTTGTELWIPSENIWYDRYDGSPCATYNSYEHAVEKGEILSICKSYEDGYYVKKNGVCGWYRGRLEG